MPDAPIMAVVARTSLVTIPKSCAAAAVATLSSTRGRSIFIFVDQVGIRIRIGRGISAQAVRSASRLSQHVLQRGETSRTLSGRAVIGGLGSSGQSNDQQQCQ